MYRSDVSPWIGRGLYLFALVLVVSPLVDLLSTIWPPRVTELRWRYGALGLAAGYLHTPMLGIVLALLTGLWIRDSRTLRRLGVLMIGASVALLGALGMFGLDLVDIRALGQADSRGAVTVAGTIQGAKYATASLVLLVLGLGALKTSSRVGGLSQPGAPSPGIVSAT